MKRIEVAIPVIRCLFTAEVLERGPLHPLDLLVLGAIRDGITEAGLISQNFSLHRNIVDQVIVRLINEELVALDFETDTLRLDGIAIAAEKDGTLQSLAFRGSPSRRRFHAFQDLIWGHIIPFRIDDPRIRFGSPSNGNLTIAPATDLRDSILTFAPTSIASLFNSQRWLTYSNGQRWMAQNGEITGMPESRRLLIDFTPFRVTESIEWWPAIQESGRHSSPEWASLTARIRQWLQDHPPALEGTTEDSAIPNLRSSDERRFVPFTSLNCLEQVKSAASDDEGPSLSSEWHAECAAAIAAQVPVRLVCNADGHVSQCKRILNDAQNWCVIHSAFWSEDGIRQFLPEIRNAVSQRGVQVYLFLGLSDRHDDLDIPECLAELRAELNEAEGELLVNQIPTRSHSKVVAADDSVVLVSSFNFLGATEKNPQLNAGLLFTRERGLPSTIVADVVRCLTSRPVRDDILAHLEQHTGTLLQIDENAMRNQADMNDTANAPLSRLQDVLRRAREPRVVWELVESSAHRDMLLNALHSATTSVFVTSGDLSRSAVDSVFRSYVADAIVRGVSVRMLWGSQTMDPEQQVEAESLARELHDTWSDSGCFEINLTPGRVHSKLLVVDDWVSLVSSYNFLSYRGTRDGAHELGVKVFSSTIALQLVRMSETYCPVPGGQLA